ncbi:MAG: SUMF1/EgtB/PvdO family nonheme iron enzyme [Sedimenticola sp.]
MGSPVTFRRVVRGGSWINNSDNARASIRNNNNEPDNRNNNLGFRLSCLSHIDPVLLWRWVRSTRVVISLEALTTSGTVCRSRFADRGEEWIDGAGWSRPHGAYAIGHIANRGASWITLPKRPALYLNCPACRSQPPNKRPISATISLTC